jgi:hypothetical protein
MTPSLVRADHLETSSFKKIKIEFVRMDSQIFNNT